MTEQFEGDWLDLREPFDAAARDIRLPILLADQLPARPRILDLGAGTGSLLRWLGHFIGRAQAWTLVDADSALIDRAFGTIAERAVEQGWAATWPNRRTLLAHAPGGAWRVEGLVDDLREAPDNLPLDQMDAVVNTALCDLVSADWVFRIAAGCAEHALPFYAALNVTGRERFMPGHPTDALVARGFARDQLREKGFSGLALGAKAPAVIEAAFLAHGYTVHRAPSDWVIARRNPEMAAELADGHARAALAHERRGRTRIINWMVDRRAQAGLQRLSVRVGHQDVLCLPPVKE